MDMNNLAHDLLNKEDLIFLDKMLADLKNDSAEIMYRKYKDIISFADFLFESIDDYIDFTEKQDLNEDFLICSYLQKKSYFIMIGGFEEDITPTLTAFVNDKTSFTLQSEAVFEHYQRTAKDSAAAVFTDYDGDDNFFAFLTFLEKHYLQEDFAFLVFFDDLYYHCGYHVAIFKKDLIQKIKEEWEDRVFTAEYPR